MSKWNHNTKVDCKNMGWDIADWIALDWIRSQAVGYCERVDWIRSQAVGYCERVD